MNFSAATKEQLYQISVDDLTPLAYRYEAARELQFRYRRWKRRQMDEVWRSFKHFRKEAERIRHGILQMRDEMESFGVTARDSRTYIAKKLMLKIMQPEKRRKVKA